MKYEGTSLPPPVYYPVQPTTKTQAQMEIPTKSHLEDWSFDRVADAIFQDEGTPDHLKLGDLKGAPPDGLSAYSPVHFEPATTPSGNLAGYAVEATSLENERIVVGRTSPNYLLVKNIDLYDMAMEITSQTSHEWEVKRTFFDGSRYALHMDIVGDFGKPTVVGDTISMGVIFRNSYDGSTAADFMFYAKQLICVNGCVSSHLFDKYRFRHTRENENWEDELRKATAMLRNAPENLQKFVTLANTLANTPATAKTLEEIFRGPMGNLGPNHVGRILKQYWEKEEQRNLYGLLSAGTNVYWHDERQTMASYRNNDQWTSRLLRFAEEHLN